jgi:hypothetical protein
MLKAALHTRVPRLAHIESFLAARLDGLHEEAPPANRNSPCGDFIIDYHELCLDGPLEMSLEHGQVIERGIGRYLPRRVRFTGVRSVRREGLFTRLEGLPLDHPARSLRGMLSWIPRGERDLFSLLAHGSDEPARLWITARACQVEVRPGPPEPVAFTRDWSPPPPFRAGLIPELTQSRLQYGGDPVTFRLGEQVYRQRLFVGDIESQSSKRPRVDAVLNVGEEPSRWALEALPADRWVIHGEGDQGMSMAQITEEATWVIERLRKGRRVLVHCMAGLNRSTTVCCAVLILLEGLTAQAALERVRDRHAWARPDENHWLRLKWLAKLRAEGDLPLFAL